MTFSKNICNIKNNKYNHNLLCLTISLVSKHFLITFSLFSYYFFIIFKKYIEFSLLFQLIRKLELYYNNTNIIYYLYKIFLFL